MSKAFKHFILSSISTVLGIFLLVELLNYKINFTEFNCFFWVLEILIGLLHIFINGGDL